MKPPETVISGKPVHSPVQKNAALESNFRGVRSWRDKKKKGGSREDRETTRGRRQREGGKGRRLSSKPLLRLMFPYASL